jgi:DNA repair protein RadC
VLSPDSWARLRTPSRADIQMTQQIIAVASPPGISVHDHCRQRRACQLEGAEADLM